MQKGKEVREIQKRNPFRNRGTGCAFNDNKPAFNTEDHLAHNT